MIHRGDGDLHDPKYSGHRRSVELTDPEQYSRDSPAYTLSLYPNDELYGVYTTGSPEAVAAGAVLTIVFTAVVFFVFDWYVYGSRQAFRFAIARD